MQDENGKLTQQTVRVTDKLGNSAVITLSENDKEVIVDFHEERGSDLFKQNVKRLIKERFER